MVIGQQRNGPHRDDREHIYPYGLRKVQRLVNLAAKFNLPMITLIDTQGAHPGLESEEQGSGNAVATTLSLIASAPTPIISVIVGEGGSEGALALGLADRILMQQYTTYSPLSPERAASRMFRDPSKPKEAPQALKLTARDCLELGIIDEIVPEPEENASANHEEAAHFLRLALLKELAHLTRKDPGKLVKNRYKRFRKMGEYSSYFREALRAEISMLQRIVLRRPRTPKASSTKGNTLQSKEGA